MNPRLPTLLGALLLGGGLLGAAVWWRGHAPATGAVPMAGAIGDADEIPIPPFPPRITETDQYDKCMTMIADDPEGAETIAESWQQNGGGDAATHCQALALIATGDPETGAEMLEDLAHGDSVSGLLRATILSQAAQARLIAEQAEAALKDTTEALTLSPDDPDLLIGHATAADSLSRSEEAMNDLNHALQLDPARGDALVLRAAVWRRMDMLTEARSDIEKAVALDPDDAEALLERGILRQRAGDLDGARADWTRARDLEPNSEVAELAAQNLTLLDAGPERK